MKTNNYETSTIPTAIIYTFTLSADPAPGPAGPNEF
jgi:hypothetical protein